MELIPFESLISARREKEAEQERRRVREAEEALDSAYIGALLTKHDLEEHRAAVKRVLDEHRAATQRDLEQFRAGLRRDLDLLRRDIRRFERRLTIKIGSMLAVAVTAVAALTGLL